MPSAASLPIFREHAFVWALVLSVVLHGILISTKGFEFDRTRPADSLIIELQQAEERIHSVNRYFRSTHNATTPSRHVIFFPSSYPRPS